MDTITGTTRIELGDTVRLRGSDIIGIVAEMRYAGLSVTWEDRNGQAPTWHSYSAVELISKS